MNPNEPTEEDLELDIMTDFFKAYSDIDMQEAFDSVKPDSWETLFVDQLNVREYFDKGCDTKWDELI